MYMYVHVLHCYCASFICRSFWLQTIASKVRFFVFILSSRIVGFVSFDSMFLFPFLSSNAVFLCSLAEIREQFDAIISAGMSVLGKGL